MGYTPPQENFGIQVQNYYHRTGEEALRGAMRHLRIVKTDPGKYSSSAYARISGTGVWAKRLNRRTMPTGVCFEVLWGPAVLARYWGFVHK